MNNNRTKHRPRQIGVMKKCSINSPFPFGNTALQPARPAGPPISVIPGSFVLKRGKSEQCPPQQLLCNTLWQKSAKIQ